MVIGGSLTHCSPYVDAVVTLTLFRSMRFLFKLCTYGKAERFMPNVLQIYRTNKTPFISNT